MTKINNTVTEVKNPLKGFINRLDTAEKIIGELEDMSTETPQTEKQRRRKNQKHRTEYPQLWDHYKRSNYA